jgi:poly(A) polymerase Pap1
VRFFIHKNWLRLDFDCNGKVTKEDLKNNFLEFYEFIKSYEYYQKAMEIKAKLYEQAIKYMQKEVDEQKKKESEMDESDKRVE